MSQKFDTLDEAVALENAGVDRSHAQAIVRTIHQGRLGLAMKDDIDRLRGDIRWGFGILLACGLAILSIVAGIATALVTNLL